MDLSFSRLSQLLSGLQAARVAIATAGLVASVPMVVAAPYEAKIDQLDVTPHQERAFSLETKWVRPPEGEPGGSVLLGRAEVTYGLTRQSEIAFNLFASRQRGKLQTNGGKVGHIQVFTEDEKATWRFGMANELVYVVSAGEPDDAVYEFAPIIQWQRGPWNVTLNPSLEFTLRGKREAVFAPAMRLGFDLPEDRALAFEYFAEMGPLGKSLPVSQRPDMAYLSFESPSKAGTWSLAVGRGVRAVSDRWVLRLIAAFPFH